MKTRVYILSIFLGIISACQVRETDYLGSMGEVTFFATSGDVPVSKTTLQADGAIWWNPNDEINIFYGDVGNYRFTSTNTSTAPDVEFKGSLKYEEGKDEYWAVYPYSSENTFDGSSIKVSLPSEQYAVKDSFKDDLFISIAKTTDQNLTFYNVCGGVKFSVAQPGVISVVFKGNNNETLAGTASVSFDSDGKPFVKSVSDAKTEITVSTENGDSFEVGAWYYIVAFPEKLTLGYTMTFTLADAKESVKTNSNPVTIKRSIWGILKDVDTSLESDIPEAVDLGLSVKWASCNIGASKPEDSGNYYAWGETETKNDFSWLNYKWSAGSNRSLTKYNTKSDYGVVDYKIALDIEDDVAHVVLGGDWRMPTYTEIEELIKECNWQMETVNGVNGFRVLGPNGNSIFLPVSDKEHNPPSGTYWSSTGQNGSARTFWFIFMENLNLPSHIRLFSQGSSAPYMGNVVRPVNKAFIPISGISLDQSSIPLKNGASQKLTATILPDDATNKTVTWASSDTTVATVSSKGIIVSLKAGTTNITAYSADGNQSSSCEVTVYDPISTPEAIDLGLSVKWSSSNIGAYYIGDIGESYEWGNIEPFNGYQYKDKFNPSGDKVTYTKYTGNDYDTLQPEDDAAHVLLGEKWRIPTREEWKELMDKDNCDWTWGSANGQNGYYVTSRINGNSIFLPDRDSRIQPLYLPTSFYWSSSLYVENPSYAFSFYFSNDSKHIAASYVCCSEERRYYNFLIRPVYGDYAAEIPVTGVSLNKTSIELVEGESFTLVATVEPVDATDKTVKWTSSDSSIASVDENGNVTGIEAGETSIIVTAGDKTATCKVVVNKVVSQDVITFADSNIKAALVAAFDTNGDGELSVDEAAAVASGDNLKSALMNIDKDSILSFDEFQYFVGLESIPDNTFQSYGNMKTIKLPNSIKTIGAGAFGYCSSLSAIDFPDGLKSIGDSAFHQCESLSWVHIPNSMETIGWGAFTYTNVKELHIDDLISWLNVELSSGAHPFSIGTILESTEFQGHLFIAGNEAKEIIIPPGITEIKPYTFQQCANIVSISIPSSVTTIGNSAFEYCTKLKAVSGNDNISRIGNYAFNHCSVLASFDVMPTIENIGTAAFQSCRSLNNLELGTSISSIQDAAFYGCSSLTSIIVNSSTVPTGGYQMFGSTSCSIYVPSESIEDYKKAVYWRNYADRIQVIPGTEPHSYVDLGLSVKWATYNVGVSSPQEQDYGGYYAWGETEVKTNYSSWGSYKWCNGSEMNLTKYCSADGKTVLELEDDAAYVNFGHNWRIPTNEEWTELIEKCTWTWTNNYIGTGVKGMIVEGSNGNSIFLPAAGGQGMPHFDGEAEYAGDYWSSSLNTMEPDRAYYVYFDSSGVRSYSAGIRCFGFSVRPVSE